MKKIFVLLVAAVIFPTTILSARSDDYKLSLAVSTGPGLTGYTSKDGSAGTLFWNLAVTPDFRFNANWGLTVDLGAGAAIAGVGCRDEFNTLQAELYVGPYYEFGFGKCYLDVMAGPYARYRQMFYGDAPFKYVGMTIDIGAAVGVRAGYNLTPRTDIFGSLRLEPSILNPIAMVSDSYINGRFSGNIQLNFGVRFRLSK